MAETGEKEAMSQNPGYLIDLKICGANQAKIEQVLIAVKELGIRIDKMHELHRSERKDFWEAINDLRKSITGNNKEGLTVLIDRNTRFRQELSKWLILLFAPFYGGLIALIVKMAFDLYQKMSGG